jgi:hypothetical protein
MGYYEKDIRDEIHNLVNINQNLFKEAKEANRLKRLEMSKLYPDLPRELDELEDQA